MQKAVNMSEITKIGVIGAGTMGAGIAQVAAASGFEVALIDTKDDFVSAGVQRIESGLQRLVDRDRMAAGDRDTALARISAGTRGETLAGSGLVVEAVVESFEVKKEVFRQAAEVVGDDAILASNTSSISITALAATVPNP